MTRIRPVRMMMLASAACALVVLIAGCPSGLDIPEEKTDDPVGPHGPWYAPGWDGRLATAEIEALTLTEQI